MTISTDRFFNNNSELFNKLNSELKSLQAQAEVVMLKSN